MPEGDTIHRTAAALRMALLGKPMTAFEAARLTGVRPSVGSVIERVASWGKHLEIGFDDGIVLHTHMRMTGAWHLYHPGQRWRRSARSARVVIEVPGWQAVCFSAPVVDTYRAKELTRHPLAGSLGPDLCRTDANLDDCVQRMDTYVVPDTAAADVLLDQRIACGVGNVYKSEVLWAVGLHPLSAIGAVDEAGRRALIEAAARLLRANLDRPDRTTIVGGLAVYGRTGKPCPRCGAPIEVARHGEQARVTYWCPSCQERLRPEPDADAPVDADRDEAADPDEPDPEIYRPYEIPRPWRDPRRGGNVPRARLAVLDWIDPSDPGASEAWYGDGADDAPADDDESAADAAFEPYVPLLPPDLRDDPYAVDPLSDPWANGADGAEDGEVDSSDETDELGRRDERAPIDPLLG